jgi:hypothetical protein
VHTISGYSHHLLDKESLKGEVSMATFSLTANDEMIERSLPGFAAAWEYATKKTPNRKENSYAGNRVAS